MEFIPPNNQEAEQAVIGSCLLDGDILKNTVLHPDDFYKRGHALIWSAMLSMSERKESIDLITLTDHLKDQKQLSDIGGASYLSQIAADCFTSAMFKNYQAIVKDKAIRRNYIKSAHDIISKACNDEPIEEIKSIYKQEFTQSSQTLTAKDVIKATVKHVDKMVQHGKVGLTTGFIDIDNILGGFVGGNLYIIGARPGMGKTALAINSCNQIVKRGHVAGVFSIEMPVEQIGMRIISDIGNMSSEGFHKVENYSKFLQTAGQAIELPIVFDFRSRLNLQMLSNKIDEMVTQHKVEIIFLDYLTLIKNTKNNRSREAEVSEIARTLKTTAREYNIPIVALTQLNRSLESRDNKQPKLSDLRESGAIEQDADVVMFIYRDVVYDLNTKYPDIAKIIIAKNRHGDTGYKNLKWDGKVTKFKNLASGY